MFEFLLEILKNKNKNNIEITKTFISNDFYNFLKENNIILKSYYSEICFVDISKKEGYIKILPYSKYLNILKKYNIDINKNKNNFIEFYKNKKYRKIINKNINLMRIGKWLNYNIVDNLKPHDIEKLVIKYKDYQESF